MKKYEGKRCRLLLASNALGMASPPSHQRALVSYAASQAVISSPNWNRIHDTFVSHLPLRNIHWKPPTRAHLRTIQELDVTLIPLDKIRDESVSQIPVTLLEKPLLNVYFLFCEVRTPHRVQAHSLSSSRTTTWNRTEQHGRRPLKTGTPQFQPRNTRNGSFYRSSAPKSGHKEATSLP